jgi:hypothetical protein
MQDIAFMVSPFVLSEIWQKTGQRTEKYDSSDFCVPGFFQDVDMIIFF